MVANNGTTTLSRSCSAARAAASAPHTTFPAGGDPRLGRVADFNTDRTPTSRSPALVPSDVSVVLGGSGGTFGAPASFAAGTDPTLGSRSRDFNADSDPDLAVANNSSNDVSILLGGAGRQFFGAAPALAAGDRPRSVAIGDFNGDSDPDLAVVNGRLPATCRSCSGGAGGSFGGPDQRSPRRATRSRSRSATSTATPTPTWPCRQLVAGTVSILLGGPGGSFGAPIAFTAAAPDPSVAVGDFNADADPDLAVANLATDSVSCSRAAPAAASARRTTFAVGDNPWSVAVGDFNADSKPDLAVANSRREQRLGAAQHRPAGARSRPRRLAFGRRRSGRPAGPRTVAVANTGDAQPADRRRADQRAAGATDFDRSPARTAPAIAVLVGEGCAVSVAFAPNQPGARSAPPCGSRTTPRAAPTTSRSRAPAWFRPATGSTRRSAGPPGADTLVGTASNDVVALLGGDDSFRGGSGNDTSAPAPATTR